MTHTTKLFRDLKVGDTFLSNREEEGIVTVVCPPGQCTHDRSRDSYSCHVVGTSWERQWFVNADPGNPPYSEGDSVKLLRKSLDEARTNALEALKVYAQFLFTEGESHHEVARILNRLGDDAADTV